MAAPSIPSVQPISTRDAALMAGLKRGSGTIDPTRTATAPGTISKLQSQYGSAPWMSKFLMAFSRGQGTPSTFGLNPLNPVDAAQLAGILFGPRGARQREYLQQLNNIQPTMGGGVTVRRIVPGEPVRVIASPVGRQRDYGYEDRVPDYGYRPGKGDRYIDPKSVGPLSVHLGEGSPIPLTNILFRRGLINWNDVPVDTREQMAKERYGIGEGGTAGPAGFLYGITPGKQRGGWNKTFGTSLSSLDRNTAIRLLDAYARYSRDTRGPSK